MVQCKKCKLFVSLAKDEVLRCKGPCDGVFHKKCIPNLKQFKKQEVCEECRSKEDSPINQTSRISLNPNKTSAEEVLEEVNKKLEIIFKIEQRLEDLASTVDFYSEQYQLMMEYKDKSEKKITALEQRSVYLEKCNKALEERIVLMEQKEKEKNLEIIGLEQQENENPKEAAVKIATTLQLDPVEIEDAKRVGVEKKATKDQPLRPRPLIVILRSKEARDLWLKQRKTRVTNGAVYGTDNGTRIFINEDLTRHMRQLLWSTKNQLHSLYKYIWIQNSKILVKKNETENKIHSVGCEDDIKKLIYTPTIENESPDLSA